MNVQKCLFVLIAIAGFAISLYLLVRKEKSAVVSQSWPLQNERIEFYSFDAILREEEHNLHLAFGAAPPEAPDDVAYIVVKPDSIISSSTLNDLQKFKNVTDLSFSYCRFSDDIDELQFPLSVRRVRLRFAELSVDLLRELKHHPSLIYINVDGVAMDGEDLFYIHRNNPQLTVMTLPD